ncbi:MAG: hypothetical protein ACLFN8_00620 [Candidatus Woesearchaeota archaeon]
MVKKVKKKVRENLHGFYLGFGLFIVFLVLWFITSQEAPSTIVEEDVPFDNLSASQQIDVVKQEEQKIMDDASLSIAISMDNPFYCDNIVDDAQRAECLDSVSGDYVEPVADNRSEQDLVDESMFSLAVAMNNVDFCKDIIDEDLNQDCLDRFN